MLKVARCRNNSDGPGSYPDNLYGAYPDGDIGRTRTQQQLIAAILKKALSNPQKINSYVNLFLEYVDTDLEFSEALWFAQPALGLDFSTGFASATLAGENVYYVDSRGYRWGSCYELDPEAALETVNSLINPYNAPLTAADLNIFQKP
ncbi:MAG: LCP family protein [Flavonifractor plautii]